MINVSNQVHDVNDWWFLPTYSLVNSNCKKGGARTWIEPGHPFHTSWLSVTTFNRETERHSISHQPAWLLLCARRKERLRRRGERGRRRFGSCESVCVVGREDREARGGGISWIGSGAREEAAIPSLKNELGSVNDNFMILSHIHNWKCIQLFT